MKDTADRSARSRVLGQKINEAIAAKDFKAAEAALEEMFADVTGPRRAVLPFNKARILMMLDPAAKEKALKHVEEAIVAAQGDEAMTRSFKAFRDKLMSAEGAAPKPAGEPKKGA